MGNLGPVYLFLSLLSLYLSVTPASASGNGTATCPMDLDYVLRISWPASDCKNFTHSTPQIPNNSSSPRTDCCQTLLSVYGVALAENLKRTSLFQLPDLQTSVACLSDFQSKLNSLSLPSTLTSQCFDPLQFVITPNICASIQSTRDWLSKLGPSTVLDSACRPDLTDLTACDSCVAAGFRVQSDLIAIDGNKSHSRDCFFFTIVYAAGMINQYGPESESALTCLFGLPPPKKEVECQSTKFSQLPISYYPANGHFFVVSNARECNRACLSNCSCSAYAYNGSRGCSVWNWLVFSLQQHSDDASNGGTIYLKGSASESESPGSVGNKRLLLIIIPVAAVLALLLLLAYITCYRRHKFKSKGNVGSGQDILLFDLGISGATTNNQLSDKREVGLGENNDPALPLFTFASVSAATGNFSAANKLGEGGFGPVYEAWDLWMSNKALDLMDLKLYDESSKHMGLRYVNVALLCVQEIATDRPTMVEVVSMLTNETLVLSSPKQPAFSTVRGVTRSPNIPEICSVNDVTISLLEAR